MLRSRSMTSHLLVSRLCKVAAIGIMGLSMSWGATHAQAFTGPTAKLDKQVENERNKIPEEVRDIDTVEQLGAMLPLDLTFTDSDGNIVKLGDYFGQDKPVILNLGYYRCPMLCSLVIGAVEEAVGDLDWELGRQYEILTISIDPEETYELAHRKREETIARLQDDSIRDGWHFLVGDEQNTRALADSAGFGFKWVEQSGQYVHQAVIVVVSPEGKIARYHYGVAYPARDVKFSLITASNGSTASALERLIMSCYQFDPKTGTYSMWPMRVMRIAGVGTLFGIGMLVALLVLVRKMKQNKLRESAPGSTPGTPPRKYPR